MTRSGYRSCRLLNKNPRGPAHAVILRTYSVRRELASCHVKMLSLGQNLNTVTGSSRFLPHFNLLLMRRDFILLPAIYVSDSRSRDTSGWWMRALLSGSCDLSLMIPNEPCPIQPLMRQSLCWKDENLANICVARVTRAPIQLWSLIVTKRGSVRS